MATRDQRPQELACATDRAAVWTRHQTGGRRRRRYCAVPEAVLFECGRGRSESRPPACLLVWLDVGRALAIAALG